MAVKPHAVTWNELRFYVGPRPAGGDALSDELAKLTDAGVDVVVSLLTAGENFELELTTEAAACVDAGMSFVSVPVPDREVPESDLRFIASALEVYDHLAAGRIAYVHCRAGIGRATLFACTLLVLAGALPNDALGIIEDARGVGVPDTAAQAAWIRRLPEKVRVFKALNERK